MYKFVMYGPVLVTIGVLGMLGNILSIVVFTRSSMKKSAIHVILIGKYDNIFNNTKVMNRTFASVLSLENKIHRSLSEKQ